MRFIKKHKYKLLTLMLSIVSIFTLFLGINKTYAYETNTFSYTISSITTTSSLINITNNNNIYTINNNDVNSYITDLRLNLITSNTTENNITLLINYDLFVSNDNITFTRKTINNTATNSNLCKLSYNFISNNTSSMGKDVYLNNTNAFFISDKNYFSNTIMLNKVNATDISFNAISLSMGYAVFNSASYWKLIIYNVDIVDQTQIGLSQYYETYYGQIEDNYNALLSNYNDLQHNYDTLEGNYNTLQDNYDTLEDNYNQLNGNINNLNDFYNYGFIAFMKNGYTDSNDNVYSTHFTIYYADRNTNTFLSKEYPLTLNDIVSYFGGSSFSLYDLSNYYIDLLKNSITNFTDLYYISECNLYFELQSLFNIEYIDFINNDFTYDMELFIRNSVDNIGVYFNALDTTNTNINSTKILEKNSNLKQFNSIEFDRISYDSDLHKPFITLNNVASAYYNNGFNNGYQSGLQQGKDSQQTIINDLNNQITILTSRVTNLEYLNQALNEQINSFNTDYNLNNLMWTIASTPFDSFKQIWNVNFFGVNISSVITGFLTGIIVLWIIKKFFL